MEPIFFYEHDYYPFSNFSAFMLKWKKLDFMTSEHVYHWEKFPDSPALQDEIRNTRSAHEAFKLAEKNKESRRPDWDDVKVGIMKQILQAKVAQHSYVRKKLSNSGIRPLIEDSWRDDFWGWGPNKNGKNTLGSLWMEIRDESRHLFILHNNDIKGLKLWLDDRKKGDEIILEAKNIDTVLHPTGEKNKLVIVITEQFADEPHIVQAIFIDEWGRDFDPESNEWKKYGFFITHFKQWIVNVLPSNYDIFDQKHVHDFRAKEWVFHPKI